MKLEQARCNPVSIHVNLHQLGWRLASSGVNREEQAGAARHMEMILSIARCGKASGRMAQCHSSFSFPILEANTCFSTDVGTSQTHKRGQQRPYQSRLWPKATLEVQMEHSVTETGSLGPNRLGNVLAGAYRVPCMPGILQFVTAGREQRHSGQSWQLEIRDRWSRAHPIESCMREGVESAKALYYRHNAEIQYMTPIWATC